MWGDNPGGLAMVCSPLLLSMVSELSEEFVLFYSFMYNVPWIHIYIWFDILSSKLKNTVDRFMSQKIHKEIPAFILNKWDSTPNKEVKDCVRYFLLLSENPDWDSKSRFIFSPMELLACLQVSEQIPFPRAFMYYQRQNTREYISQWSRMILKTKSLKDSSILAHELSKGRKDVL